MSDTAPLVPPTPVVVLDDIDSTNAEGMRRIAAGERGPLWIRAVAQRAGRGRSGRTWVSAPGNHYASLILEPWCAPAHLHQLTLVTGVAVFDAITSVAGPVTGLALKWPNDVLVGHAKLCGILIESVSSGSQTSAVIGIGVNLAHAPSAADTGRVSTFLAQLGRAITPDIMLDAIDQSLAIRLDQWRAGAGFPTILKAWQARGTALGTPVTVNTGNEVCTGRYAGLDADGAMRLQSGDGAMRRVTFGDVTLPSPDDLSRRPE